MKWNEENPVMLQVEDALYAADSENANDEYIDFTELYESYFTSEEIISDDEYRRAASFWHGYLVALMAFSNLKDEKHIVAQSSLALYKIAEGR